jgi:hypothetical protein
LSRQIIAVRLSGGQRVRHIAGCAYLWLENQIYQARTKKVDAIISDIESGQEYFTRDSQGTRAHVEVVEERDGSQYIRTLKDGSQSDNLLRLPRYGE